MSQALQRKQSVSISLLLLSFCFSNSSIFTRHFRVTASPSYRRIYHFTCHISDFTLQKRCLNKVKARKLHGKSAPFTSQKLCFRTLKAMLLPSKSSVFASKSPSFSPVISPLFCIFLTHKQLQKPLKTRVFEPLFPFLDFHAILAHLLFDILTPNVPFPYLYATEPLSYRRKYM